MEFEDFARRGCLPLQYCSNPSCPVVSDNFLRNVMSHLQKKRTCKIEVLGCLLNVGSGDTVMLGMQVVQCSRSL